MTETDIDSEFPGVSTIRQRLPYSPGAFGYDDTEYDAVLADLRVSEIDRIETYADTTDADSADALHDGSDPVTAFEEIETENVVDGIHAVRTPREQTRTPDRLTRNSDRRLDRGDTRADRNRKRRRTLPLPARPVNEVHAVEVLGRDLTLTVGEDVYLEDDAALVLDRDAPLFEWPQDRRNIRVEYNFGNDGVPSRIRDVLVDLVHIRLAKDEALAVESESMDGQSYEYRDPAEVLEGAFGTILSEVNDDHNGGVFCV